MLGESHELWIRTCTGEDPGIAFGEGASTFALERTGDYYRPTARGPRVDDPVNEIDKLVWKPDSDLLAHPITVAKWERYRGL